MKLSIEENVVMDLQRGLTDDQVAQSRTQYGPNTLTPPQRDSWVKQLLEKFDDPTIRILLAAAAVSLLMTLIEKYGLQHPEASFIDSVGIVFAILLATLAGFFSERKSAREFELLNKVKDDILIKTRRNGQVVEVPIAEIVVGDIVHLDLGDKIPADGVVLESHGLLVDQSLLTGESVPVEKQPIPDPIGSSGEVDSNLRQWCKTIADDDNQVFRGTMIGDGHGLFAVTEVGDNTRLGQIAATLGAAGETENDTPLVHKLSVLAKQISVVGVTCALLIFMVMGIAAIWKSPLFTAVCTASFATTTSPWSLAAVPLWGILSVAILFGCLGMWFVLRPFFASMDMTLNNRYLQAVVCIPMAVAVFGIGLAVLAMVWPDVLGYPPTNAGGSPVMTEAMAQLRGLFIGFVVAVTIIVVAVPEGLPMMVTVSLAMNMMKMARENCLIRKLVASETIGSATVICSDKTGTLTQNRMSPTWVFTAMKDFQAIPQGRFAKNDKDSKDDTHGVSPQRHREHRGNEVLCELCVSVVNERKEVATLMELPRLPEWQRIVESIATNTEAALSVVQPERPAVIRGIGNPTECALLSLLHQNGVDYHEYRDKYKRDWELSHNSQRKMSAVCVEKDGQKVCYIKGAPEKLLSRCSHVFVNGHVEPIEPHRAELTAALETASKQALRVIAITEKILPSDTIFDIHNIETVDEQLTDQTFLAMVGISDPIRPEVPAAIETCRQAGVDVKMITGDAVATAVAIARQAGILPVDSPSSKHAVLTSAELAQLDDITLAAIIPELRVLARATPLDKLRLIKAMHADGEVVAMTGDGTNDAPALKSADVGISMGLTGTEVAKEASDIVLIDDNFKSIVTGIWWGRTLYQNIQRFLQFQLSVNVVALLCALIGPFVGVPLPLTVPQLLWINIIMDTFAAIALSTDPPRKRSMQRKPIPRDAAIITPAMGVSILLNGLYQVIVLFTALYLGWFLLPEHRFRFYTDPKNIENIRALTVFFTIFIMFQFWHKFNCRSLSFHESPFSLLWKNPLFIGIVTAITVSQVVLVQASEYVHIGDIFRTVPLSFGQWGAICLLTATILPVSWLVRFAVFRAGLEE